MSTSMNTLIQERKENKDVMLVLRRSVVAGTTNNSTSASLLINDQARVNSNNVVTQQRSVIHSNVISYEVHDINDEHHSRHHLSGLPDVELVPFTPTIEGTVVSSPPTSLLSTASNSDLRNSHDNILTQSIITSDVLTSNDVLAADHQHHSTSLITTTTGQHHGTDVYDVVDDQQQQQPVLDLSAADHHHIYDAVANINMNDMVSFELTAADDDSSSGGAYLSVIASTAAPSRHAGVVVASISPSNGAQYHIQAHQTPRTTPIITADDDGKAVTPPPPLHPSSPSSPPHHSTPTRHHSTSNSQSSHSTPPPLPHGEVLAPSPSSPAVHSRGSHSPRVLDASPDSQGGSSGGTATTSLDYSNSGGTTIDIPDTKEGIEELCPVCGDKVSGYHYGLLTCESCKGFFKRTVQNKKVYTCVAERQCQIDKTQRKRCPYCRFQKCLDVGMKLEAVRQDRMRGGRNKFGPMYKRDRARKLQLLRQRQMTHPGLVQSRNVPVSSGVSYSSSLGYTPAGIHIKEEIQSPFLSSSTSSPDSSPAPIRVLQTNNSSSTATGGPSTPHASSPATIITQNNISLWVGAPVDGGGTANGGGGGQQHQQTHIRTVNRGLRMPELVPELLNSIDDNEWTSSLMSLLQNQTYNQCEVDLFELMCKVLDQNLFAQVDWARNSIFFKDLRVDDQMKLLQQSWSDMLLLDHLHQRLHNNLTNDVPLANGQNFSLLNLALLGTDQYEQNFNDLLVKMEDMALDVSEYVLIKFTMLLNSEPCTSDSKHLTDKLSVDAAAESIRQAMMDYCAVNQRGHLPEERVQELLNLIPQIHYIADCGEKFLYLKMMHSGSSTQTLLMEMLHTKRR